MSKNLRKRFLYPFLRLTQLLNDQGDLGWRVGTLVEGEERAERTQMGRFSLCSLPHSEDSPPCEVTHLITGSVLSVATLSESGRAERS